MSLFDHVQCGIKSFLNVTNNVLGRDSSLDVDSVKLALNHVGNCDFTFLGFLLVELVKSDESLCEGVGMRDSVLVVLCCSKVVSRHNNSALWIVESWMLFA